MLPLTDDLCVSWQSSWHNSVSWERRPEAYAEHSDTPAALTDQ